jgi:hypothetical protein
MPTQFQPLRDKSALEFLGAIPGPATIGEDFEGLLKIFNELPFAKQYKERLLNMTPKRIPGGGQVSNDLLEVLGRLKPGKPGLATEAFAGPGSSLHPALDPESFPDWALHVFRDEKGSPLGYMTQGEGAVQGLATNPNAAPTARAKAMLNLAQQVIKNRLDPGEVTGQGADLVAKLQKLAKRAMSKNANR